MFEGVWRHPWCCSKRSFTGTWKLFYHPKLFGKQELDIVMSHLKNEVFSRHARHYCCSYYKLITVVERTLWSFLSEVHHEWRKTSQLSAVVHHFPPGAEVDVPAIYQKHNKSSWTAQVSCKWSIDKQNNKSNLSTAEFQSGVILMQAE